MRIANYNNVNLLIDELKKIAHAQKCEWQSINVSYGACPQTSEVPITSENIKKLFEVNLSLIKENVSKNRKLNSFIFAIVERMASELALNPATFEVIQNLKALAETDQEVKKPLPNPSRESFVPEVLSHILSFATPSAPKYLSAQQFFNTCRLVSKAWKARTKFAESSWIKETTQSPEILNINTLKFLAKNGGSMPTLNIGMKTKLTPQYILEACSYCPNAHTLILNNTHLTSKDMEVLKQFPNIKHLELRECTIIERLEKFPEQLLSLTLEKTVCERFPLPLLPETLEKLSIKHSTLNTEQSLTFPGNLKKLEFQDSLTILSQFQSFPEKLKSLIINDDQGRIWRNCPVLEILNGGLPQSLEELTLNFAKEKVGLPGSSQLNLPTLSNVRNVIVQP